MAEKTLSDFVANQNKDLSFEKRSEQFKARIKPICEELGVIPWSKLIFTTELIASAPELKDLWDSGKE